MTENVDVERSAFDTFSTKAKADDQLHIYAGLLSDAGLTDRFRVSVQVEYELDSAGRRRFDRAPTWDLVLTDHFPNDPLPAFLRAEKFNFKRAKTTQQISPRPDSSRAPELVPSTPGRRIPGTPKNALHKVGDESKTLLEWAATAGMKYQTLMSRLHSGLTLEDALTKPIKPRKK